MLTGADWCLQVLTDFDWCWLIVLDADWSWLVLIDADQCWLILIDGFSFVGAYLRSFSGHFCICCSIVRLNRIMCCMHWSSWFCRPGRLWGSWRQVVVVAGAGSFFSGVVSADKPPQLQPVCAGTSLAKISSWERPEIRSGMVQTVWQTCHQVDRARGLVVKRFPPSDKEKKEGEQLRLRRGEERIEQNAVNGQNSGRLPGRCTRFCFCYTFRYPPPILAPKMEHF